MAAALVRAEELNAKLDQVETPGVPARFEEARFYALIRGLSYTPSGKAIITFEVAKRHLGDVKPLADAWGVPLVVGAWRE